MGERSMTDEVQLLQIHLHAAPDHLASHELISALTNGAVTLSSYVPGAEWGKMEKEAFRCLGSGYSALRLLQREAILRTEMQAGQRLLGRRLAATLESAVLGPDRDRFFAELLEWSHQNAPEVIDEFGDAIRNLANGNTDNNPLIEGLARFEEHEERSIHLAAGDAALLALSRGLLALIHVNFNRSLSFVKRSTDALLHPQLVDAFAAEVADFEALLRAGQLQIYHSMVSGQPPELLAQSACSLAATIEVYLPRFAQSQAAAFAATSALQDSGKGTASEKLGRVAVRAGVATREALASHVASYRLALESFYSTPTDEVARLCKNATSLAFECTPPDGKDIELSKLSQVGDETFVEIEGFVSAIRAGKSSDGKLLSWVDLVDPSSKATATAVAVYLHLKHSGVTEGAFLRLHGSYRRSSKLNAGEPAVEVGRLPLAELSKSSWRTAFLQTADPWFQMWRNGLHMVWSLGPHLAVDPNGEATSEGAGELFYPPFVRR